MDPEAAVTFHALPCGAKVIEAWPKIHHTPDPFKLKDGEKITDE